MRYSSALLAMATMLAGLSFTSSASADTGCAAKMVCANSPRSIVDAMQKAGYRAELKEDGMGDPKIDSSASGYKYSVMFYDCTDNKACNSIQFQATFTGTEGVNNDYANRWNSDKRFVKAAIDDDGDLSLRYDVSTTGGLNQENFADVLDWWELMLGAYSKFAAENLP